MIEDVFVDDDFDPRDFPDEDEESDTPILDEDWEDP